MKALAKIVRINFFRTLEINQTLAAIWGAFIQEKHLNLSKNSKLCGILICLTPISPPQLCRSLENKQPTITVKTRGLAATKGNRIGLELLQSPICRELSLFVLSGGSLEELTWKAVLIWLDLQLNQGDNLAEMSEFPPKTYCWLEGRWHCCTENLFIRISKRNRYERFKWTLQDFSI